MNIAKGRLLACVAVALVALSAQNSSAAQGSTEQALINRYCVTCHNDKAKTAGLSLSSLEIEKAGEHAEVWEKVVQRLATRTMPPPTARRPDEAEYSALVSYIETSMNRAAAANPNPGRVATFRRLNPTEYQNAIRDLLALEIDGSSMLPKEDASHGFDSVNVGGLSTTLLERYLSAAQKISRLAIGSPIPSAGTHVVVLPVELTQEDHFDGLSLGTRGGAQVRYTFPLDGEYELQVRLYRNRNENVEGLSEPHRVEVAVDGLPAATFTVAPDRKQSGLYYSDEEVDKHLNVRVPVKAGPHTIEVTFQKSSAALIQTERQPYVARFNMNRHPRMSPAVYSVSIAGPFNATGPGDTPSRRRILVCHPANAAREADCARTIISTLARRAYRRPVSNDDLHVAWTLYTQGRAEGGFEHGIEMALRGILASTEFLFRVEREPSGMRPNTPYRISDVELASRLSFFLWSSIPDDELLNLAVDGRLSRPAVLEQQVRRMLADPRSEPLVTSFAGQWLYLRNLAAVSPNARSFPDFDENLRQAFRRETELLFESIVKEDRNVLDLLTANYTFVNQRLARHYGIPNVYGDRFRRVTIDADDPRRGLLGHGSILTVTSYATRTSPVLRGKWILENLLGIKVPPPPADVPALEEDQPGIAAASLRDRLARHRTSAVCASCHQMMDPIGLATENFDAIGRWRTQDATGKAIDVSGSFPGGSVQFEGVSGLRQAIVARPDLFVTTLTEKLLTYALGRGLEYYDAPAVRSIRDSALRSNNRFSSIIIEIAKSVPFQMRRSQ
jgi:mono/diheme cytochrome c family protein